MTRNSLVTFACLLLTSGALSALDNGLARTPPMGWNSLTKFGCSIKEDTVKKVADAMVNTGMKAAGYDYVVVDDCWQDARDEEGNLLSDAERFPHGIQSLAEYVHGKGLKFGVESDAGSKTCQRRPGSGGHEVQDAHTFARWGVDYLKYDWCNNTGKESAQAVYTAMRDALAQSGRPIVFSMSERGTAKPWTWAKDVANLWRTGDEVANRWDVRARGSGVGIVNLLDLDVGLADFAGPGHWNDPGLLAAGNGGLSLNEYRSQFSLWCMLAAPLIAANDPDTMSKDVAAILTNTEAIAVDQDPLGKQAKRVFHEDQHDIFVKPLQDGGIAAVLLNRGTDQEAITLKWANAGLPAGKTVSVRNLWEHKDLGQFSGDYSTMVPAHSVVMITMK